MYESDEDEPPPLNTLQQQIDALNEKHVVDIGETCGFADITPSVQQRTKPSSEGMRKGFLLSGKQTDRKKSLKKSGSAEEHIVVTAKGPGNKSSIPEFLKIPEAEEYAKLRDNLVSKFKPTPETVAAVQDDKFLSDAFSDQEIMSAVGEIAANPSSFQKYKNNPKVVKFYEAFGQLVGSSVKEDIPR